MKLFTGCIISAGLMLMATAASAQRLAPYEIGNPYSAVSDVDGPYAAMPPEAYPPRYGPTLLPPREVYTVVRESGFSPLGIPQQRGFIYTIAVINGSGDDGRLVIDARTGRILHFMPASRMGDHFNEDMTDRYGPVGPPPPADTARDMPRPPAPLPRLASRMPSTPLPKSAPRAGNEPKSVAAKSSIDRPPLDTAVVKPPVAEKPAQQSASVQVKPAEAPTATSSAPPAASPPAVEVKPSAQIQPTQEMPKVQGFE